MDIEKIEKRQKRRREFVAGFVAGITCLGSVAFILLLIFSL